MRRNNEFNSSIIVNFLSKTEELNKVDTSTGINHFVYNPEMPNEVCQNLKHYWKTLVLQQLRIRIYFKEASFFRAQMLERWKPLDFNILQKAYYEVHSNMFSEYLVFMHQDNRKYVSVHLKFEIFLWVPSGVTIHDEK